MRYSRKTFATILLLLAGFAVTVLAMAPSLNVSTSFLHLPFLFFLMFWITMGTSLNMIFGYGGYAPLGFVGFYGVGSYVTALVSTKLGFPMVPSVILGAASGVLLAFVLVPTFRLAGAYFAIVNFASAMALQTIITIIPGNIAGGAVGIPLTGLYEPIASYYFALFVMIASILTSWAVSRSKMGLALKCMRDRPEAAEVVGIDIAKHRLRVWILGGIFPSLLGGIDAYFTGMVDPATSFNFMITTKSIVYPLLGGMGTLLGPIVGSLALYFIDEVIWVQFPFWNQVILGLVLVLLILFMPRGIVGTIVSRFPKWRVLLS